MSFKVGDTVQKIKGYEFVGEVRSAFTNTVGYIVADFTKTTGERRLVVECINTGMLHVFNESNLEPAKEGLYRNKEDENEEMFFYEIKGKFYIVPDSVYDDFCNDHFSSKITDKMFEQKYRKYWTGEVLMKNKLYLKPKK